MEVIGSTYGIMLFGQLSAKCTEYCEKISGTIIGALALATWAPECSVYKNGSGKRRHAGERYVQC